MSHIGNYHNKEFEEQCKRKRNFSRFKTFWLSIYRNIIPALKRLSMGLFLALAVISCRTQPPTVIQKEEIIWTYKDSITTRDSICYIPIERYVDIVPIYDTLLLSTSISESRSWVDTTNHILRGELKNKNAIQYQVKYVERVIKNDSIVERKVPQPYPVIEEKIKRPWWAWICLTWTVLCLIFVGFKIYFKFWKP